MGQAKKRGTFEERKQQSIEVAVIEQKLRDAEEDRRYAERQRAVAEAQARVDAMPEDEREAYVQAYRAKMRRQRSSRLGGAIAIAALVGMGAF